MNDSARVTVIGLGPMGRAMVRTLLAAGHVRDSWSAIYEVLKASPADERTGPSAPGSAG